MMNPLTAKQKKFLQVIFDFLKENKRSPTFMEICSSLGFRSPHTVTCYLAALGKKGWIRKQKNKVGTLEILMPIPVMEIDAEGHLQPTGNTLSIHIRAI